MPSQLESFFLHGLLFFFSQLLWFDLDVILSLYKGVHHFTLAPLITVTVQTSKKNFFCGGNEGLTL